MIMKISKNTIGIIYVILSATLFGMMPLLARIAYAHGSNACMVAFSRFFFGSIMLRAIILVLPNRTIKIRKDQFNTLLKLSLPYAAVPIMLYMSYNYIDSGMATTLHFTYPIAVMLIMVIFCKSRLETRQVVSALFCIGGMIMLYSPNGQMNVKGVLLAVFSGILYAVYIVLLGKSDIQELNTFVIAFWISMLSAAEIGFFTFISGNVVIHLDAAGLAVEVVMAFSATVLALVLFQKGVFLCGEVKASLFSTFEPLSGIVIGVIVLHEVLSIKEMIGIAGILISAILLVIPTNKHKFFNSTKTYM